MIPLSDDNPTLRIPVVTIALLILIGAVWVFVQSAGFDPEMLAASVCNLGLVAGEITRTATVGAAVPIGEGMTCVVDSDPINYLNQETEHLLQHLVQRRRSSAVRWNLGWCAVKPLTLLWRVVPPS